MNIQEIFNKVERMVSGQIWETVYYGVVQNVGNAVLNGVDEEVRINLALDLDIQNEILIGEQLRDQLVVRRSQSK